MDRQAESFEEYYRRDYRSLLGLAYVIAGPSAAEDLVQEALLETHRRWAEIAYYDQPSAWVRRVMLNKHRSRLRRLRTEARGLVRMKSQATVAIAPTERSVEVWTAVRALPRRQAQVVALYYWDGRPLVEIADILEIAPETAKTHLKRGRASLAESLASLEQGRG